MRKILALALSVWVLCGETGNCKIYADTPEELKSAVNSLLAENSEKNKEIFKLQVESDTYKEILLNIDKVLHDKKILKKDESIL